MDHVRRLKKEKYVSDKGGGKGAQVSCQNTFMDQYLPRKTRSVADKEGRTGRPPSKFQVGYGPCSFLERQEFGCLIKEEDRETLE
ncbi:hypothetical protein AVEN_7075-1, partial [Araneus ventricosus]